MLHARRLSLPIIGTCVLLVILAPSWTRVVAGDEPSPAADDKPSAAADDKPSAAADDKPSAAADDKPSAAADDTPSAVTEDSSDSLDDDSDESSEEDSDESSEEDSTASPEDSLVPSADGSSPSVPEVPSEAVMQVCDEPKIIEGSPPITDVKLKIFITSDDIEFTGDRLHKKVNIDNVNITLDGSVKDGENSTAVNELYNCTITGEMEFNVTWPDKKGLLDAPGIKNCTVTLLDLERTDGTLDAGLQDSVKDAVSKAALSCVKQDICAKMCWSIQEKIIKKKMKKASKKAIPLVTEWLFQTLVKRMVYPNRTFTLNLPPPDKETLEEFLSLDKLNSSVWFSSGVLTATTSLINMNVIKPFKKPDKKSYDFDMFFKVHNLSIFYEEWKYITPNDTSKGPVRLELQNLGLSMQFIVSWTKTPATLKFNKFELTPSDTHIVDFPGAPGLADNETSEMHRLLKASVHSFINTELKEFIVAEKNLSESDPNLEMFRPAFEGTIKLKKVKLT